MRLGADRRAAHAEPAGADYAALDAHARIRRRGGLTARQVRRGVDLPAVAGADDARAGGPRGVRDRNLGRKVRDLLAHVAAADDGARAALWIRSGRSEER